MCAQVVDAAGLPEGARKVLSYHRAEADELVPMQPSNEGTDLPFRVLYMSSYVNVLCVSYYLNDFAERIKSIRGTLLKLKTS